jgi:enoyl-CoA hydratase/carnithine racemase
MSDGELVREQHDAVTVLRLNRPEARNALTPTLLRDLGQAVADAEADPQTRAVVLTGTGDRAFCSGMDLRAFTEFGAAGFGRGESAESFMRVMQGRTTVPLVGAANGSAVAGGLELLLGCDLVVLAHGAKLALPEVQRGLIPGGDGTTLGTRIPLAVALEMVLTGDGVDAARALQVGLVNAVVPAAEVLPTAMAFAERIAANGPLAVVAAKELVRLATVDSPLARERLEQWRTIVFPSEDAKEGARAFVEKRRPHWQGR